MIIPLSTRGSTSLPAGSWCRFLKLSVLLCTLSGLLLCRPAIAARAPEAPSPTHAGNSTAEPKVEKFNRLKTFGILVAIFSASCAFGAGLGVRRSPDFEDSATIADFVATHARFTPTYVKTSSPDGKIAVTRSTVYRFPTGIATWVYDSAKPRPEKVAYSHDIDGALPPRAKKKLNYPETLSALGIITVAPKFFETGGQVQDLANTLTGTDKVRLAVYSILAVVSGFAIGYMLAYSENPNPESKAFQEQLADRVFWEAIAGKRRVLGEGGWRFFELSGTVQVEDLAQGVVVNPVPFEAVEGLRAVGETALATRLAAQKNVGRIVPLDVLVKRHKLW